MSEVDGLYVLRPYQESDHNFVMATFLRGLYYGNEFYRLVPKKIFMDNYKMFIEALLQKSVVIVACLKDDPSVILGYSVVSKDMDTVHWVFIKTAWRKQGIGKSLLPATPQFFSHFTTLGLNLGKRLGYGFNPFAV